MNSETQISPGKTLFITALFIAGSLFPSFAQQWTPIGGNITTTDNVVIGHTPNPTIFTNNTGSSSNTFLSLLLTPNPNGALPSGLKAGFLLVSDDLSITPAIGHLVVSKKAAIGHTGYQPDPNSTLTIYGVGHNPAHIKFDAQISSTYHPIVNFGISNNTPLSTLSPEGRGDAVWSLNDATHFGINSYPSMIIANQNNIGAIRFATQTPTLERMTIINNGNVGIGIINPQNHLSVANNLSVGYTGITDVAPPNGAIINGNVGIGVSAPLSRLSVIDNLSVGYPGTLIPAGTNISIFSGNVGIGTDIPDCNLQVIGNTCVGTDLNVGGNGTFGGTLDVTGLGTFHTDVNIMGFLDVDGHAQIDMILTVGDTSTNNGMLQVNGSGNITQDLVVGQDLQVGGNGDIANDLNVGTTLMVGTTPSNNGILQVNGSGTVTQNFTIGTVGSFPANWLLVNGNVGIGTTTPNCTLDVSGNACISTTLNVDGNADFGADVQIDGVLNVDSNGVIGGDLQVNGPTGLNVTNDLDVGGNAQIDGTLDVDGNTAIDGNLQVNGGQGLTVTNTGTFGGSVGIGTTTPAAGCELDVVGNACVSGNGTFGGSLSVMGSGSIGGTLTVGNVLVGNGFPILSISPSGDIHQASTSLNLSPDTIRATLNAHGFSLIQHAVILQAHDETLANHETQINNKVNMCGAVADGTIPIFLNGGNTICPSMIKQHSNNTQIWIGPSVPPTLDQRLTVEGNIKARGGTVYADDNVLAGQWYGKSGYIPVFGDEGNYGRLDQSIIYYQVGQGQIGIGTTNPNHKLTVSGNVFADNFIQSSDVRFKKTITRLDSSLSKILSLQGVSYNWKREEFSDRGFSDKKQIGVIAQEVEEVFPEIVITDEDGYKSVDYSKLTAPIINAIKEIVERIVTAEQRIEKLEAQNNQQQNDIAELQKVIAEQNERLQNNKQIEERLQKLEEMVAGKASNE